MIEFLILYAAMSSLGWIWIIMGISTLRDAKRVRERERVHAAGKVIDLIPETIRIRHRRARREIRTVWHPVVEFSDGQRVYRLQSPSSLQQGELAIGEAVDIYYDADDPTCFHFEWALEHDVRTAKIFIAVGIVWAVAFSPFLIHRELSK